MQHTSPSVHPLFIAPNELRRKAQHIQAHHQRRRKPTFTCRTASPAVRRAERGKFVRLVICYTVIHPPAKFKSLRRRRRPSRRLASHRVRSVARGLRESSRVCAQQFCAEVSGVIG